MSDSTLISSLPDKNNFHTSNETVRTNSTETNSDYQPLNLHKQTYGIPNLPQISQEGKKQDNEFHRLASRDIPMNTQSYTHDNEIKANYIPPPQKNISDYLRDYEEEDKIQRHKIDKHRKYTIKEFSLRLQEVVLIGVLFFISEMAIISGFIKNYCTNLGIYNTDGSINKRGMVFKSITFSLIYAFIIESGCQIFPFV